MQPLPSLSGSSFGSRSPYMDWHYSPLPKRSLASYPIRYLQFRNPASAHRLQRHRPHAPPLPDPAPSGSGQDDSDPDEADAAADNAEA